MRHRPHTQKKHYRDDGSAQENVEADNPQREAARRRVSGRMPDNRTGVVQWWSSQQCPFPIGDRNDKTLTAASKFLLYWRADTSGQHKGGSRNHR